MDAVAELTPSEFEFPSHQCIRNHALGATSSDFNLYLCAGLTAIFTSSSFNALDCLRVRWQTQAHPLKTNIFQFASQIIHTEGFVCGLWRPGIAANALGMGSSAALRFGSYEQLRDQLQALDSTSREVGKKSSSSMIAAGLISGAMAYSITTPFHLLKTCLQAERALIGPDGRYCSGRRSGNFPSSILCETRRIISTKGIMGLYKGCLPLTIRGSLFTGGQMFGYDGFKSRCKETGMKDGPQLQIYSSLVSAMLCTVMSTPADFVMSKYMISKRNEQRMSSVMIRIYKSGGALAFWRGSSVNFVRITPVIMTFSIVYEQMRLFFGFTYLS